MKRAGIIMICAALSACGASGDPASVLQGYGEADYIYVSAQDGGVIGAVPVREGDVVETGDIVFELDPDRMGLNADAAAAQRSAQREAVRAAEADLQLAERNLARGQELFESGFYPRARLDSDQAARDAAAAKLQQARRALSAARADTDLARQRVNDLEGAAPADGTIQRVYHRAGEVVAAGQPIVALLAPQNMKIRFFVPEPMLAQLHLGDLVDISCDGCTSGQQARISYIATEPQFTPPVIYSLEQREKLVFLIEARPLDPTAIRPGLPVDVTVPDAPAASS